MKYLYSFLILAVLLLSLSTSVVQAAQQINSNLQIVTSPLAGGDMKWVLTVRGSAQFPQSFNNGQVTALRLEGDPIVLRNMWQYDSNDNVWVWKQYIPENVIGLMIDTPTYIDFEFLQANPHWKRWYWGNIMFRDFVFE